jgi:hypothetical protein
MIVLTSTNTLIVKLGASGVIPFVAGYADISLASFALGQSKGWTNGASNVTLIGSPAGGVTRQVKNINVANTSGGAVTSTILMDGYSLVVCTLQNSETLEYIDTDGFHVLDANGYRKIGVVGPLGPTGPSGPPPTPAGTSALTNVAGSASSVTLLAINTSRLGASIFNDSAATLYVKFGTTASITSYTVQLSRYEYYEVPFGYTGRIDGIWSAALGNARICELTA